MVERSAEIESYHLYIDGKWVDSNDRETVTEIFSGAPLGTIPVAGFQEFEQATVAAVRAFESFKFSPRHERHRILRAIQTGIRNERESLANLIARDCGKPLAHALAEVDRALITFELAAGETLRFGGEWLPADLQPRTTGYSCLVSRFPAGPIAAFCPFNFPLNLLAHKLAPALAVGCTMVVKTPPQAPLVALRLAAICEAAGVPPGVFNVLHMPVAVAEKMAVDTRFKVLSFTGSARVGWHLKSLAVKKKVLLELGGNAGAIVHDDADLPVAVERILAGAFAYAGQVCIKVQRLWVHRSVYKAFLQQLTDGATSLQVGDPMLPGVMLGPVIDRGAYDRIMTWIQEAVSEGATLVCGGRGEYPLITPTILENASPKSKVSTEEIFGPVLCVAPYDKWEDALAGMNAGQYGLQAGIFTHDMRRIRAAYQQLDVGGVVVNDVPTVRVDNFPYGGVKESGFGREGVRYAMEELTEPKALLINGF